MTLQQICLINIGAIISALGGIFLKKLSNEVEFSSPTWVWGLVSSGNAWIGGVCYLLPILLWTYLLKSMELTKLQPALSIVYVYTVGFAYLLLNEHPSVLRLVVIGVVITGVKKNKKS